MLTQGGDVEAQALRLRAWTISTIARHLDRDPKTIRADVNGQRQPGRRASTRVDPLAAFAPYLSARFVDDPHLWASALFDAVVPLGYRASYVSFARQLRRAGLRPHCEPCAGVSGRPTIEIDHPAGAEMQWDWFERRKAPWGGTADVLLGTRSLADELGGDRDQCGRGRPEGRGDQGQRGELLGSQRRADLLGPGAQVALPAGRAQHRLDLDHP